MVICEEFWDEYLVTAKMLYYIDKEAEIYDVFEFIRSHQQGASPYGAAFLKRIDGEIMKEEGSFEYHGLMG